MESFLSSRDIDRQRWDATISECGNAGPYAYSWYLDCMCPDWYAMVNSDYSILFPMPLSSRFGYRYIFTPVFLQKLGIFSTLESGISEFNYFFNQMPGDIRFVDLAVYNNPNLFAGLVSTRTNYILNIKDTYEEIVTRYSSDCRRNIRLSKEQDVEIKEGADPDILIELFKQEAGRKLRRISKYDYSKLKNLISYCVESGRGKVLGGYYKSKLIYGVFYLVDRQKVTILFTSTTDQSRFFRTGYLAIDQIVSEFAGKGMEIDFAGSSIRSIADFFESFGSSPEPYYRLYVNRLPFPVNLLKRFSG